jgi:hypothetical protein
LDDENKQDANHDDGGPLVHVVSLSHVYRCATKLVALWKEKAYAAAARPEALILEIVAPQMDEAVAIVRPEALVGQGEVLYAELRIPSRAWIFYLTEVRHSEIVGHFEPI